MGQKRSVALTLVIALGVGPVASSLLYGEEQPHGEEPHADFSVPSLNVSFAASGMSSNNSNSTATVLVYPPETFHSVLALEELRPHDHLVIQTSAALIPPSARSTFFSKPNPRTGSDPFFQRRQRLVAPIAKNPPLSWQKFRRGM